MEQATDGKLRVAVLFGGRSGEHDVSLVSARSVMEALDPDRFEVLPRYISPEGRWENGPLLPEPGANPGIDVVFPVLHGTFGEDGTVQGLLELADLPYVGANVRASALCMDKISTKRMCAQAGIPVVESVDAQSHEHPDAIATRAETALGFPCFVKPANLGSSVGISKARDRQQLIQAIVVAMQHDTRILIERAVDAQELECAVLGNEDLQASVVGEIVPGSEFYDYEDKYLSGKALTLIPANITEQQQAEVRRMAIEACRAVGVEGMARADFFLDRQRGGIYLNEINTIPGFTPISMYSKMWEASGLPYPALLSRLISLAMERHARRRNLKFSR
jgi:D-alanine-D-alanine ligase